MKNKKNIVLPFIMAVLMAVCTFAGCGTRKNAELADMPISQTKPPRQSEAAEQAGTYAAKLYFLNEDGTRLVCEQRDVHLDGENSAAYAVVNALMKGPSNTMYSGSVPSKLRLDGVWASMDVCSVFLGGRFPDTEREWLVARLAIAAALKDTLGINGVDVFYNAKGRGYNRLPLGQARYTGQELGEYLEDIESAYAPGDGLTGVNRHIGQTVTLYYTDPGSELLAAQSGEVTITADMSVEQMAGLICEKLLTPPDGIYGLESALPADFTLVEPPLLAVYGESAATGALPLYAPQIIEITIEKPLEYYDERHMCAALAASICAYLPGVSGVRVYINEGLDERMQLMPQYEYITVEDCADLLGTNISVLYPDEKWQMLYRQEVILPMADKDDLYMRLAILLGSDGAPAPLAPLTKEDVAAVYLAGDIAVVDWKAGFGQKLRSAFEGAESDTAKRQELLTIYSIVNTLGELPYVRSVWMSENGEKLGMINNIYLGNALMRNPGIIRNN